METAVIEIGLVSFDTAESSNFGSSRTVAWVGFSSLPQCQHTVSVDKIV